MLMSAPVIDGRTMDSARLPVESTAVVANATAVTSAPIGTKTPTACLSGNHLGESSGPKDLPPS